MNFNVKTKCNKKIKIQDKIKNLQKRAAFVLIFKYKNDKIKSAPYRA